MCLQGNEPSLESFTLNLFLFSKFVKINFSLVFRICFSLKKLKSHRSFPRPPPTPPPKNCFDKPQLGHAEMPGMPLRMNLNMIAELNMHWRHQHAKYHVKNTTPGPSVVEHGQLKGQCPVHEHLYRSFEGLFAGEEGSKLDIDKMSNAVSSTPFPKPTRVRHLPNPPTPSTPPRLQPPPPLLRTPIRILTRFCSTASCTKTTRCSRRPCHYSTASINAVATC